MASNSLRLPARESIAEINITPLIDVMLSLLVIFMIAAPMVTGSLKLPLGKSDGTPPPPALELSIADDGVVSHKGLPLTSLELQAEMYAYAAGAKPDARNLHLTPSPHTQHQQVIAVLNLARSSGISAISIDNVAER